jgi:DNA replication protein DnaC
MDWAKTNLERLQRARQLKRETILNEITSQGSVAKTIKVKFALLMADRDPHLDPETCVSKWDSWEDAESRLVVCQTCQGRQGIIDHEGLPSLNHCRKPVLTNEYGVEFIECPVQKVYRESVRAMKLLGSAQIPEKFKQRTLGSFKTHDKLSTEALKAARSLVEKWPDTKGILFLGPNGTGKTHLAAGIMLELIPKGIACRFYTVPNLMRQMRSAIDDGKVDEVLMGFCDVPLLILDDLGKEFIKPGEGNSWASEILFTIVNDRYENEKRIIVTTNLDGQAISERYGPAVRSRFAEMMDDVPLVSSDFRMR